MPAGRPTSYEPAYCEQVIELGKAGKSRVQMAAFKLMAVAEVDYGRSDMAGGSR